MKFRLLLSLSRFTRSWPFSEGLMTALPRDGIGCHGPAGDLRRASSTPWTTTAEGEAALRYARTIVLFEATSGTECAMACIACVTSSPSELTFMGGASP